MIRSINLHTWGGLGAQLSSLITKNYLQEKYPNCVFKIIVHEDPNYKFAYSKFETDISLLPSAIDTEIVHDFVLPKHMRIVNEPKTKFFLRSIRSKLLSLQINNVFITQKIYTLSEFKLKRFIRHLTISNINIDCEVRFYEKLIAELGTESNKSIILCHWRLGDLYLTSKKSAGSDKKYLEFLNEILVISGIKKVQIHSESVDIVRQLVRRNNFNFASETTLEMIDKNVPAIEIVKNGLSAEYFIGSISKLSAWIAVLRIILGKGTHTYIPKELIDTFNALVMNHKILKPNLYDIMD